MDCKFLKLKKCLSAADRLSKSNKLICWAVACHHGSFTSQHPWPMWVEHYLVCLDTCLILKVDDSMELEMWAPYYGDSASFAKITQNQYSPQPSHAVSCFANSCKLSIIINDIIFQLYSRKSRTITEPAVQDIKRRLDLWRAESPAHLRYEADSLPSISPPPHIISQKWVILIVFVI